MSAFVRYIEHPSATTGDAFITPGSQLAANIYVGDNIRVNIHDAFDDLARTPWTTRS